MEDRVVPWGISFTSTEVETIFISNFFSIYSMFYIRLNLF